MLAAAWPGGTHRFARPSARSQLSRGQSIAVDRQMMGASSRSWHGREPMHRSRPGQQSSYTGLTCRVWEVARRAREVVHVPY